MYYPYTQILNVIVDLLFLNLLW